VINSSDYLEVNVLLTCHCRLKAYCIDFFGRRIHLSGISPAKTQPIRTIFSIHGHVKWWQRSRNFGSDRPILSKMGAGTSPAEREFFLFGKNHATFRQLRNGRFSPNLVTKRTSVSRQWIRKDIFENFNFRGHFPPKSEIENRSNRHFTQSRLQVKGCTAERYCLLHVVAKGQGVSEVRSTFPYDVRLQSYGASNMPNFWILAYFPYTKPLKCTFRWPAYSPGVTSENDSDFSMW